MPCLNRNCDFKKLKNLTGKAVGRSSLLLVCVLTWSGCTPFKQIANNSSNTRSSPRNSNISAASSQLTIKADETAFKRINSCSPANPTTASSSYAGGYTYGFVDPNQSCITRELQEEIKNSLLLAIDLIKPQLQETISSGADIFLKEVLIFRTQSTALRICGMADGKLKTVEKKKTPENPPTDPASNAYNSGPTTAASGTTPADPCLSPVMVTQPTTSTVPSNTLGYGFGYGTNPAYGNFPSSFGAPLGVSDGSAPVRAAAGGVFDILTTDYRVSFVFADREGPKGNNNPSGSSIASPATTQPSGDFSYGTLSSATPQSDPNGPQGNIYRYSLSKGLTVEELIDVQLKSSLNADLIDTLPEFLGKILANFFQEISVSINGGGTLDETIHHPLKNVYSL